MSRLDEQELLNIVADEIGTKDSPLHHLPSDGIHVSYRVRRDKQGGISLSILIVIVYPNILLLSYLWFPRWHDIILFSSDSRSPFVMRLLREAELQGHGVSRPQRFGCVCLSPEYHHHDVGHRCSHQRRAYFLLQCDSFAACCFWHRRENYECEEEIFGQKKQQHWHHLFDGSCWIQRHLLVAS